MAISQFFVVSARGDTIIRKICRLEATDLKNSGAIFFNQVKNYKGTGLEAPPIFNLDGVSYIYNKNNGLYFLAVTQYNISPALVMELLNSLQRVFKDYCGVLTEEAIRKNFNLIYELLDEILDNGHIQGTSSELLKTYVFNEPIFGSKSSLSKLTKGVKNITELNAKTTPSSAVQRPIQGKSGKRKEKNEIFVDIMESLTTTFDSHGNAKSFIDGVIQMKSYLRGNPQLKLALNDIVVQSENPDQNYNAMRGDRVVLDDVLFHERVNISEWASSRTLTVLPPDGEFNVLNYRVSRECRQPFKIFPSIEKLNKHKVEYSVRIRADIPEINYGANMKITFTVPSQVASARPSLAANSVGEEAEFDTVTRMVIWKVKKFKGGEEKSMRVNLVYEKEVNDGFRRQLGEVCLSFEVPTFNVSGLQVRYLRINSNEKNYNPFRWVRYVTRSQSYVCRV